MGTFASATRGSCSSVSLAFTGPILELVKGPRSGGFQLFGDAETGKSTAGMVAGSIWGRHRSPERREKGFTESWHTTAGQVELTALAHNHMLLVLDETKRAGRTDKERGSVVIDISFNFAEQTERERMNECLGRCVPGPFISSAPRITP